jgi:hypothetical protein
MLGEGTETHTRTDGPRFPGGADMVVVFFVPIQVSNKRPNKEKVQ